MLPDAEGARLHPSPCRDGPLVRFQMPYAPNQSAECRVNNPPEPASGAAPAPAPSLVGRATEVGVLTGALERATGGEGSIVLVSGEAGVGKSRLTRELLARAREQGSRIAVGRAAEGTGGRPFGMLVELLRAAARTAASTAERAACDSALAALAQESDAAGVVSRWAQIDAIVDALAAGSTAEPPLRVVAFEDLHWADASTMELITQVLRQMESVPILALATFRPPPADAQALLDFIENTRGLTARQRIDLEPLTEAAAEELVRSAAGTDVSTDAIADIVQRAAGNPLFLEEAARDAGRAARDGIAATRVPLAIRDLIQRRVSGLSEAAREIIAAFSVLGTDGDPNLIVLVLAARPDAVAQAVNELVAADLLAPDAEGRLAFRHALTRDAVYESLPVLRRRDLHARCADAIDVSEGERGAAAVAWHLQQVGNVDALRRAGRLLITASEQSLAQLAYEQAATQLRDAVRILTECRGDPAVLRQAALHLAEAQRLTCADDVSLDAFATVADDAALARDAHTEATAAIGYERTFLATGRPRDGADARSITLLDRALDHLTAAGPLDSLGARVLAASAQARYFAGDHQSAQEMAHRAVDVARAMADAGAEASALNTLRAAITTPDTLDDVLSLTRTIVERAAEAGDVELQLEGLFWRIAALLEVGRRAEAEAALARYGVLAERIRQRWRLSELYRMRGMFAHLSGDADTARAMAEQALQFGLAAGNAESRMYYTAITAVAAPEPERREPIRLLMEDVPLDLTIVRWQAFMAYFAMCAGDRERTAKYMAIALETGLETVPRDHAWLIVIAWVAEAAAYLGDPRAAQAAYDLLLPYADRYVVATNAVCLGSVEDCSHASLP